ncbi:MAG TPA: preprotein translocase subunit SecE [Patescibacteria group bacterium]
MLNPLTYLSEVQQELQKVSWPTYEQTAKMTALVITISAVVALYLVGLDYMFNELVSFLISA